MQFFTTTSPEFVFNAVGVDHPHFTELDDDTLATNFRVWLGQPTPRPDELNVIHSTMDDERPFAVRWPDSGHGFGVTWSSSSPEVTRAANAVMGDLHRRLRQLRGHDAASLPALTWFHQGGSDQPTGWQYWEMFGTSELAMCVCEAVAAWLPGRVALLTGTSV